MTIGVMDSGIGGLNVLAALIKNRCGDRYIYLSDGANLPYGSKAGDELRALALEGCERLTERGANVIVFGCNTLSVSTLDYVRKKVIPPVFGLYPRPDLLSGKALLLTTPTTALYLPKIERNVTLLTPPDLASVIDEEYPETSKTSADLSPLLLPYRDYDEVYLGCSHYLYAKAIVRRLLPRAKILGGCEHLAKMIRAVLPSEECKNPSIELVFTGKNERKRYLGILSDLLK